MEEHGVGYCGWKNCILTLFLGTQMWDLTFIE